MSKKKNYRAMYNNQTESVVNETSSIVQTEEEPIETSVSETVDTIEEPKCEFVIGKVTGCARLNVREAPDLEATVICIVPVWSEVQICTTHEHDMWYHIYTAAGQEGYCMKQFIEIN